MKLTFPIITEDTLKLPLFARGIGLQQSQEHISRPDGYTCYHWLQCISGTGRLMIDNREFTISEGMAFFFHPNIPHEYYALSEPWTTKWLIFDGSALPDLLSQLNIGRWEVFNFARGQSIEALLDEIYFTLQSGSPVKQIECTSLLYAFLIKVHKHIHPDIEDSKSSRYKTLQPVIAFINERFGEDITLEDMAQKIHVTTSYLCRIFNQTYAMSPFTYLNRIRIQKAKELLFEYPGMTVNDVSRAAGYNSTSYFCAVFKRLEDLSPEKFRKIHGMG
jgi:AraC family transcriptional regulator of arabinose operon